MKIKILFLSFLVACCFRLAVFAGCEIEPVIENVGKILKTETFRLNAVCDRSPCEVSLTIVAAAKDVSWSKKDAEAVALTIFVDGKYNQDLLLFAGAEKFRYQTAIGRLTAGKHEITVALNEARSAKNSGKTAEIHFLLPGVFSPAHVPDQKNPPAESAENSSGESLREATLARAYSHFIYARPNAVDRFTDIPLVTYYEIFKETNGAKRIRTP